MIWSGEARNGSRALSAPHVWHECGGSDVLKSDLSLWALRAGNACGESDALAVPRSLNAPRALNHDVRGGYDVLHRSLRGLFPG